MRTHNKNSTGELLEFLSKAKGRIDFCSDPKMPSIIIDNEAVKKGLIDAKNRGIKTRFLTNITKENISYSKELARLVDELRGLNDIKANFAIHETQYAVIVSESSSYLEETKINDDKEVIQQQRYLFDILWNKAIPAKNVIEILEKGTPDKQDIFLRSITNYDEAAEIFVNLAKSAEEEALLMLSNSKAMVREYNLGVLHQLVEASKRGVDVKIISPLDQDNADIVIWLSENAPDIKILDKDPTTITVFIIDNQRFLKAELKKGEYESFPLAIGFVIYSNSKPTVAAFKSFFELFWKQSNLNEKLRKVNEELRKANEQVKRAHDAQKDFVNMASHETKTPNQAILGYSDLLLKSYQKEKEADPGKVDLAQAIHRNASRLQKITNEILDVARIESNTLRLHMEEFNLNDIISDAVKDIHNQIANKVRILYQPVNALIEADKGRLTQVVLNILGNAIKLTEEGTISIKIEKGREPSEEYASQHLMVSIQDTGIGIDPEIEPKLFSKFISKSNKGIGLGLYISKNIIEAHGGKIWAENNPDGKGATFSFILPIVKY